MTIRIGFSKTDITPPLGIELAGYAALRRCNAVHDPLYAKAVVLEQEGVLYALIALDLLCVDESLSARIAKKLEPLGIAPERLIVCAIHSHSTPRGVIPGEGPLREVSAFSNPKDAEYLPYIESAVEKAARACEKACGELDEFTVRASQGEAPKLGSERHTGETAKGLLTAMELRTRGGKSLIVYDFPCHPTVMSADNLAVSADFVAGIEKLLGADMAVFCNGAAGDVSTRFTRRESSFTECERMGAIAAESVKSLLRSAAFREPEELKGVHCNIRAEARTVESVEGAVLRLERATARWKQAEKSGEDAGTLRTLKSFAEGAGTNLQFARSMQGVKEFLLPVTVFKFCGLKFAAVPGELFSALLPEEPVTFICYSNGYYRYIADEEAYDAGYYEALGAILARGEGERLVGRITELLVSL